MMGYQPRSISIILRSHMLKAAINRVTIVLPSIYTVIINILIKNKIDRLKSLDGNKYYIFIQGNRRRVDFVSLLLVVHITKAYF